MRRHALSNRAFGRGFHEDSEVAVRVNVDETGRDVLVFRIDRSFGLRTGDATHARHDRPLNSDIRDPSGRSRSIENPTVSDHDVEGHRTRERPTYLNSMRVLDREGF